LRGGVRYVLYDQEAGAALRDRAVTLVEALDRRLPRYTGQPVDGRRLILPFIGRLGDAIVTSSCLGALKHRYPAVTVDIAAPAAARATFALIRPVGCLLPYPIEAARLDDYDHYLSFEEIEAVPRGDARSCADAFSRCLHTPRPHVEPQVIIPSETRARWVLQSSGRPRAAIHVGVGGSLRTYPMDLVEELTGRLIDERFDVYLIGLHDNSRGRSDAHIPHRHDLTGRTPTPADLAAVLDQMNILITGDSFPLHLAGALGTPTLALFTATDHVLGSDYPSVMALQSKTDCSPCHVADGACPLGHTECVAHRDPSFSPTSIVNHIVSIATAAVTTG